MADRSESVSVVVRRDPARLRRQRLLLAAGAVALAVVSWWLGASLTGDALGRASERAEKLATELEGESRQRRQLQQQLANLQIGAEVDRRAVEDIRKLVKTQQQTIVDLREEISFYKGLMAPTERERGVGVRSWELYRSAGSDRYQFRLTVQQLAVKHALMSGQARVDVVGRSPDGGEKKYSLHELSEAVAERDIKLRFRYFQNIEGEIVLPEGFEPRRVDVVVNATRPKRAQIEKTYAWVAQDSGV